MGEEIETLLNTASGISLYTVSQLLGHSKTKTAMIYAHLSKNHLKNSVDNLNF